MKRLIIVSFCFFLILCDSTLAKNIPLMPNPNSKLNVFILNSYHPGKFWTDQVMKGIAAGFEKSNMEVEFFIEYMDTRRYEGKEETLIYPHLERLFSSKYKEVRFDIIIASDDSAFMFLLPRHQKLFPDTPIVVCGINKNTDLLLAKPDGITGFLEAETHKQTISLSLQNHKNTEYVVLINDDTLHGEFNSSTLKKEISKLDNSLQIIELTDLTIEELAIKLQSLPTNSVLINPYYSKDTAGKEFSRKETIEFINRYCNLPIYWGWDLYIGWGIIGGITTSGYLQGENAAKYAIRIIEGEAIDQFPIRYCPNATMFDYTQMKRFDISLSDIPEGSIVINEPQSFYYKYKKTIRVTLTVIFFQFLTILMLLISIQKQKWAKSQKSKLEEQLIQSQKMEAIGILAGGVAHDFNNILMAINGNSAFILRRDDLDDSLRSDVEEIKKAGERAATLTRQLLAFSRKQILEPKIINLNELIENMLKMLERLIGEDIQLNFCSASNLDSIKIDPGQVEQVIMNIAVNSRDAMIEGGTLTIETQNVILDEDYVSKHVYARTGPHVMLAISDTGHGMDKKTQARIFEPFFTTKERDKGTGLGMSTVYGILKQCGGNISVYSEIGKGTTFRIYFPSHVKSTISDTQKSSCKTEWKGTETVLIVEDDEMVLKLTSRTLRELGYNILEARNGLHAIQVYEEYAETIHLVITDVIMPEMNGPKLVKHLSEKDPDIKVLYMSGYTDDAIAHHGILEDGLAFLQKPTSTDELARKVREVICSQ